MYGSPTFTRVDPLINFYWGMDDALTPTGKDYISVRWTGYLLPAFSEIYQISLAVNDGVRVWIDGQLVIDAFENEVEDSASAAVFSAYVNTSFVANQLVAVKIEYRENTGTYSTYPPYNRQYKRHTNNVLVRV